MKVPALFKEYIWLINTIYQRLAGDTKTPTEAGV